MVVVVAAIVAVVGWWGSCGGGRDSGDYRGCGTGGSGGGGRAPAVAVVNDRFMYTTMLMLLVLAPVTGLVHWWCSCPVRSGSGQGFMFLRWHQISKITDDVAGRYATSA